MNYSGYLDAVAEIEAEVNISYQEWLNQNNYGGFYEIETPNQV